ncbi:MAG TPA: response regulator transcription factor [Gaiellaceae bacterium]|nr:response regulator transcription factor [Gaiellaceae bacterium]
MENAVADRRTVLIADDHDLFAESLGAFLGTEERIEVVGRASNGDEAARMCAELRPDVVLMDISMPVLNGFDAAKLISDCAPDTAVLFLTGSASPADVAQARAAGGVGYVTKDKLATELIDAIVSAPVRA